MVGQAWQKKSWREAGEQEIDRLEEGTKRYEKDLRRNEEEIQRKDLRKREDGLPRDDWVEGVRNSFNVSRRFIMSSICGLYLGGGGDDSD